MSTIIVQIGNSDDKLTQREWSEFIAQVHHLMSMNCNLHFSGGSAPHEKWQNYCFVGQLLGDLFYVKRHLTDIRKSYRQDSVALTIGETEFI